MKGSNLNLSFNLEEIYKDANFQINDNDKVGIVGVNGAGKTTLFKVILKEIELDSGKILITNNKRIGYLPQEVIIENKNITVFDYLMSARPIKRLEEELTKLYEEVAINLKEQKKILNKISKTQALLEYYDYYNAENILLELISNMDIDSELLDMKLFNLSGGQKSKIAFAHLLYSNPEILLLDEPTNHLDTIEWLEEYLKSYQGSLLFVSHDRYFINALATKILELDQKHLEEYVGDYDHYAKEKQLRYEQQLALYKRQQDEAKKLEWFITFYMPKPRFASRAHDREKKLARLQDQMVDKPNVTRSKLSIDLEGYSRKGKHLIEAEKVAIGYPDKPLVTGIDFVLFGGDKLAVMGPNGAGKTTFLKCLLHQLKPLGGELSFFASLSIGYLKQDNMSLSSPETIFAYIKNRFPQMEDQQIYDHLGKYAFSFEDDKKIIDDLSGGERMRVVLAEMVLHNYDLLILDEPTNHLDMMTKEEFISALNAYQGTLVIVTHDRYFADSVADRLLYFTDGKSYLYEGRYSDFKVQVLDKLEADKEASALSKKTKEAEPSQPSYINEHENKPRPRLSQDKIEEKMNRIEKEITELRKHFDEPSYYNDPLKMNQLTDQIKNDEDEYAKLMDMLAIYEN